MVFIYVLQLQDNKYYVGKTDNPVARFKQHFTEDGSAWTKKYKPVQIYQLIPDCDEYDEDKYTKIYMDKFGVDNVRGGSYVQVKLDKSTIDSLDKMNKTVRNTCFTCGESGHFTKDCSNKKNKRLCEWCKNDMETTKNGFYCESCDMGFDSVKGVYSKHCELKDVNPIECFRCGRDGHTSNKCYAKYDCNKVLIYDEEEMCYRCGRDGHTSNSCYAKKDINSQVITY